MPPPAIRDAALLAACLADRDVPCPICTYNLRGLDGMTCPECGFALGIRIGSDLRLGPWLFGVLGLCVPLGFIVAAGIFAGGKVYANSGSAKDWAIAVYLWGSTLAVGIAIFAMIRFRRWVWRRSARGQWLVAACCTAMTVLIIAWFFIWVTFLY